MSSAANQSPMTVAERLSHIAYQDAVPPTARIAVIDIGSNSVRLVIYGKNGAYPAPLFDERSNCRLGAGLDETGMLASDRIAVALETLTRFAAIIRAMKVDSCYPVATAAVRRAGNGDEFCRPAEIILGQPIQVLSQQEEATHVARGLTLNVPEASGLVADLGGGSIEIVALEKGEIRHSVSLNYGHLSNADEAEIIAAFTQIGWIKSVAAKQLFGVGGSFRALGSAFIGRNGYPLSVLHGLKISNEMVMTLCDDFIQSGSALGGVPVARRRTMPMAAKIIRALVDIAAVRRVIVSGTSIRDGVVAINELSETQRADFLVAISQEIAGAGGRFVGVSGALKQFLQPLTIGRKPSFARLLNVACNLADMCWHEHSDMRGDFAARQVLGLPVNCMTHKERIWLAMALYHRYVGLKENKPHPEEMDSLLRAKRRGEALTVGLALRFALIFSAGTCDYLKNIRLECQPDVMRLHIDPLVRGLFDSHCQRRFVDFAASANCSTEVIYD
jgi:exopolyphosphatase/guanosine-5'-triphosphate,3'-diphosphate pyrophosphatase